MDYAFRYIETNPLMLESEYAYTARDGTCKYVASKGVGKVKGFKDVRRDSSGAQLKAAIAKQPVSIAIEADQFSFQSYTSGVITHGCGGVGDMEYFLVKNSWGPSWGDHGYVKI